MSTQGMKKNKNQKIVDMLIAGIGVRFVSKVVGGNIFMLNRWKKKMELENGNGGF